MAERHGEIAAMWQSGTSKSEIARRLAVPRTTVRHYLERNFPIETVTPTDGLSSAPSDDFTEITVIERNYDEEAHYVYPLGDVHIGSESYAQDRWEEWTEYLTGRGDASMLGTGDFLNSAIKSSVSEVYDEVLTVAEAKRELLRTLKPLAEDSRIDVLTRGNHEDRVYKAVGDDPIADVADWLEAPYALGTFVIVYNVGGERYEFCVRHGTGGGMIGARATRLQRQAQTLIADVYVSGHTHSQLVFPQELFVVNGPRVERRRQYFISSGSFLNYEPYASVQNYAPQKIGAPRIRLDGTRHDIHVSI